MDVVINCSYCCCIVMMLLVCLCYCDNVMVWQDTLFNWIPMYVIMNVVVGSLSGVNPSGLNVNVWLYDCCG